MADQLPLGEGPNIPSSRRPRVWGVELVPSLGSVPPEFIRVTLVDRETGRRIGARDVPWVEFRDCMSGMVLVNVEEGVWG